MRIVGEKSTSVLIRLLSDTRLKLQCSVYSVVDLFLPTYSAIHPKACDGGYSVPLLVTYFPVPLPYRMWERQRLL